ncbi:hypothetical protein CQJ28_15785 [Escherichia sp. E2562]|nr:hypothetical protein CQJ28_15785 [Escherichia sp. E2562]
MFLYFRLKKNQRQEGFINAYPWPKKPGIFYICIPLKNANVQAVAAFCESTRGRENCIRESVARGQALINNREVSKGLKRESPSRRRGLIEGKGYDEVRHHTGCVVTAKLPNLLTTDQRGEKSSLTLVPLL